MALNPGGETWSEIQAQLEGEQAPIEKLIECQDSSTPFGSCLSILRQWVPDHCHGKLPLSWLTDNHQISRQFLGQWLGETFQTDWNEAVFLDTETTGLRPGDGAMVFLVGLGQLTDGFRLEQLLMRNNDDEAALLTAVADRLKAARFLVTFNGRGFDIPVLAARYHIAGLPPPILPPHLDLLTLARSRWRRHLPSCSLASLEFNVLQIEREQDIAGYLIPSLYQGFRATGDGRLMVPALEHNAIDILSMVTLASQLCCEASY